MYNVQGKASYITTCYIPKNKKVTGDGNQSQTDQEEVKSNFIADIKNGSNGDKYVYCTS